MVYLNYEIDPSGILFQTEAELMFKTFFQKLVENILRIIKSIKSLVNQMVLICIMVEKMNFLITTK